MFLKSNFRNFSCYSFFFLFLSSFWYSYYVYINVLNRVLYSEKLHFFFFITVLSLFIRLHYFYQSIFRFADSFAGSNLLFILSGKFFIWFIVLFNFRNFIFLINYILLSFSLRQNLPLYFPLII